MQLRRWEKCNSAFYCWDHSTATVAVEIFRLCQGQTSLDPLSQLNFQTVAVGPWARSPTLDLGKNWAQEHTGTTGGQGGQGLRFGTGAASFLQTASLKSLFVREFAPKQGTIATFKESRHGHHSYAELDVSVLHRGGALGSWPSRDRIHKNCIVKVCEVHTDIFVLASQQLLQYSFPSPDLSRK